MALEIFKLVGSILVDNTAADASLAKTDKKAQNVGKTMLEGIGTAAKWGAGIVAGASAAVGGLVAVATKSANAADNIDKQSQKLSMSAKTYQELDYVCQLYGTDVDKMGAAMKGVTTAISNNSDALKTLGISTTDANGAMKSSEEVFIQSLDALKGVSNETERNALANKLFGKSYQDLLPLLNDSSTSVEDMCKKAEDLGIVMSDDMVKSGANLCDALTTVKSQLGAVATQIGGALMPVVQKVCEAITSYMPKIQELAARLTPIITMLFSQLLPPLMDLGSQLIPIIIDLIAQIIPPITQIVSMIVPVLVKLLQKVLPPLVQLVSALLPVLLQILEPIVALLDPILDLLTPIFELVIAVLQPIITLLSVALKPMAAYLSGVLAPALKLVANRITPLINLFIKLQNTVGTAFNAIKKAIKLPHFSIKPSGWKVADLFKGRIPKLGVQWYAKGGVLNKPTAFGVNGNQIMAGGEAGPEAVAPISTLKDYIREAVSVENSVLTATMQDILDLLAAQLPQMANQTLVLDSGELVGATASKMDQALGRLTIEKARGL